LILHPAGIAATFRVSSDTQVVSAADHRLPNTDVVLGLLKWIERYMMHRKPNTSSNTTDLTSSADPTESGK